MEKVLIILVIVLILLLIVQGYFIWLEKKRNKELEKVNKVKGLYISKISHEIRTPLNGVNGSLNILAENEGLESDKYMKIAKASVKYLMHIVDDIVDMTFIERGTLEIHEEFVSYSDLETKIYDSVYLMAEEKNIIIMKPIILSPRSGIYTDANRLVQIVYNLMSNAIKFTQEGGMVTLNIDAESVDEEKEKLRIEIIDEGIGMSEETMSRMYDIFEETDNSTTRLGSGFGIKLTKELVYLLGGTLNIESELGVGTRAVVEITARWGSEDIKPLDMLEEIIAFDEPVFVRKRALLIEDNDINSEIAKVQLQRLGLEVECAFDGKRGLEMYLEAPAGYYDVIFMDIMMPIMDGYEATREIRKSDKADASSIAIVALTAMVPSEDADRTRESGMNYRLMKPFEPSEIQEILNQVW